MTVIVFFEVLRHNGVAARRDVACDGRSDVLTVEGGYGGGGGGGGGVGISVGRGLS